MVPGLTPELRMAIADSLVDSFQEVEDHVKRYTTDVLTASSDERVDAIREKRSWMKSRLYQVARDLEYLIGFVSADNVDAWQHFVSRTDDFSCMQHQIDLVRGDAHVPYDVMSRLVVDDSRMEDAMREGS